jgi:hypothetical protein
MTEEPRDLEYVDRELAALEAQRAELAARREELDADAKRWRESKDAAVDLKLELLTDEQIMGNEATIRWMCRESYWHNGAGNRKKALQKVTLAAEGVGDLSGYDGRDEYAQDVLPCIPLALVKGQDVAPLAAAIRAWAAVWALGRPDVIVDVMERTLSSRCSYGGRYDVAADTLYLRTLTYGREELVKDGPLEEVLAYMAEHVWYRKPGSEGAWDSDDEDED